MPTKGSLTAVLKERRVIPRWNAPRYAAENPERDDAKLVARLNRTASWLQRLSNTFSRSPSGQTANELYETARLLNKEKTLSPTVLESAVAVRAPIDARAQITPRQEQDKIAAGGFSGGPEMHYGAAVREIKRLRMQIAHESAGPFTWSELARHHLAVGNKEKAVQAMSVALRLSANNRYLSRAATRLFVHVGEPDRAVTLLRSNPSLSNDPWLLAAEVAVSSVAGMESRHIAAAKRLIASPHCTQRQLSEIASAVGTVELISGAVKKAKTLFSTSLVDPTENSLAQAQWALEQDPKIVIPPSAWKTPESHEATALACRREANWEAALAACAAWLAVEPFSSRPAIMGSYFAFLPKYGHVSETFATAGLRCDSKNFMLLNNRAVARAYLGRTREAFQDLQSAVVQQSARQDAHVLATLGLIAFRSGFHDLGCQYYAQSISWFLEARNAESAAAATLYFSRELVRVDPSKLDEVRVLARRIRESPVAKREPELRGMADVLVGEASAMEAAMPLSTSFTSPSADSFERQAALMRIPEHAKQRARQLLETSAAAGLDTSSMSKELTPALDGRQ